jgi:predicted XRE-type DNA-binding protein
MAILKEARHPGRRQHAEERQREPSSDGWPELPGLVLTPCADFAEDARCLAEPRFLADLLLQLQKTLASRGLTQVRAAKLLQVTQPRVSDLLRGRIDLFSTDSVIDMLARLGVRVRVVLKPARGRVA